MLTIRDYEYDKNSYLDTRSACTSDGISFNPMVAEAVGASWGPSAVKVFIELVDDRRAKNQDLFTLLPVPGPHHPQRERAGHSPAVLCHPGRATNPLDSGAAPVRCR